MQIKVFSLAFLLCAVLMTPAAADDATEANRLFVDAVLNWEEAAAVSDKTPEDLALRVVLLTRVQVNLDKIIADLPGTDLAVRLVTGEAVGPVSREEVVTALNLARANAASYETMAALNPSLRPCADYTDHDCILELGIRLIDAAPESAVKTMVMEDMGEELADEQYAIMAVEVAAVFADPDAFIESGLGNIDPEDPAALDALRARSPFRRREDLFALAVARQDLALVTQILDDEMANLDATVLERLGPNEAEDAIREQLFGVEIEVRIGAATAFLMLQERAAALESFAATEDPLVEGVGLVLLSAMLAATD